MCVFLIIKMVFFTLGLQNTQNRVFFCGIPLLTSLINNFLCHEDKTHC
jgi:hypothetical protein